MSKRKKSGRTERFNVKMFEQMVLINLSLFGRFETEKDSEDVDYNVECYLKELAKKHDLKLVIEEKERPLYVHGHNKYEIGTKHYKKISFFK